MRFLRAVLGISAIAGIVYAIRRRFTLVEDLDLDEITPPGRIVEIDGQRIHYLDQGAGPAMLLIHGFGGQTYNFRAVIPLLRAEHRCIAVDLKGYGYSARNRHDDLSHTAQVRMLCALLDRLGVARAVVVGHSMGGFVARRFAATHPEMVDALVLVAAVSGDEPFARRHLPAWIVRPLAPFFAKLAASSLLRWAYYDRAQLTPEVHAEYVRPARIRGSRDVYLKAAADTRRDPPVDDARVTMPVLLLYASHDRVVPMTSARQIRKRLPHARLVVIDRAAHLLLDERPEACVAAIRDFLRDPAPAPAGLPAATRG